MSITTSRRGECIVLRVSTDLKMLLDRAASYSGKSLSNFLSSSSTAHAKEVVAEYETPILTARDWEAFLATLDDAERLRPRLDAAARRYRSRRDPDAG